MEEISIVPIIIGLTQAVKRLGVPSKYSALIAILFGLLFSFLMVEPLNNMILQGLVYGLTASGLYSGSKALIKN